MKESAYDFRYIFIETGIFNKDYGKISESERERLRFDLTLGRGQSIRNTGGLKRIRCGVGGYRGRTKGAWEVVFAEYPYPDIRVHIYLLLVKFPLKIIRTLSKKERHELRKLKEKADFYIGLYYEKLRNNHPTP